MKRMFEACGGRVITAEESEAAGEVEWDVHWLQ